MISNNHKTTNNYMVEYELIDGYAVIDNNFSIVTANESMYKFLGNSTHYSIIDSIHQVDLDDFIDVANSLRQNIKKTMCIRMKRFDNSYRWVLMDIEKKCIRQSSRNSVRSTLTHQYKCMYYIDLYIMPPQYNGYYT